MSGRKTRYWLTCCDALSHLWWLGAKFPLNSYFEKVTGVTEKCVNSLEVSHNYMKNFIWTEFSIFYATLLCLVREIEVRLTRLVGLQPVGCQHGYL